MANRVYDKPSEIAAEQGVVLVDGPDGVALALTPDAAEEIASRLSKAAEEARRQGREAAAATA